MLRPPIFKCWCTIFGTNKNFNWALSDDETKTPDLKQLKWWLDCPYSDIQVMSWEWTMPDSSKFFSMEKLTLEKEGWTFTKNYWLCIKEDLKLFKIWNESAQFGSTQLPELTSNWEQWRKLIQKGAEISRKSGKEKQ